MQCFLVICSSSIDTLPNQNLIVFQNKKGVVIFSSNSRSFNPNLEKFFCWSEFEGASFFCISHSNYSPIYSPFRGGSNPAEHSYFT